MSKIIRKTSFILIISILFLVGCSDNFSVSSSKKNKDDTRTAKLESLEKKEDNQKEEVVDNQKEEIVDNQKEEVVDNQKEEVVDNQKEEVVSDYDKKIYLEKLNELEDKLNQSLKEKYNSGVTQKMLEAASQELNEWDIMLNEIYSLLKEQLIESEMNKLVDEEIEWIKIRDEKSEASANEAKDGSMEKLSKVISLVKSTKERCYELVNKYIK